MRTTRAPHHRLAAATLSAVLLFAAAGCDTLPVDPIILERDDLRATFRFTVTSEQLSGGGPVTIASQGQADLSTVLRDYGYTVDEVLSGSVVRADLERLTPLSVTLAFLEDAVLYLTAGSQQTAVARSDALPDRSTASLTVVSGADVTGYVSRPTFGAALQITPSAVAPNETYVLTVTVRFRLEVEGV